SRDGDVQARSVADHRNLDALVDAGEDVVGHPLVLVAEEEDRRSACGSQAGQWSRTLGEFDRDEPFAGLSLLVEPADLADRHPVDARPPTAQGVADAQG